MKIHSIAFQSVLPAQMLVWGIVWWYMVLFGNSSVFQNSVLKMLVTLLKLFKYI